MASMAKEEGVCAQLSLFDTISCNCLLNSIFRSPVKSGLWNPRCQDCMSPEMYVTSSSDPHLSADESTTLTTPPVSPVRLQTQNTDSNTQRNLNSDSNAQRNLNSDSNTQRNLNSDSNTQKNLNSDSNTQRNLNSDSNTQIKLNSDSNTQRNLNYDSNAQRNLNSDSNTQRNLNSDSNTQRNLNYDSNAQRNLNSDSNTQRNLNSDTNTLRNLNACLSVSTNSAVGGSFQNRYDISSSGSETQAKKFNSKILHYPLKLQIKSRISFTKQQVEVFESLFRKTHYPDPPIMREVAQKTGVSKARLQTWFANKRSRLKKERSKNWQESCDIPKPSACKCRCKIRLPPLKKNQSTSTDIVGMCCNSNKSNIYLDIDGHHLANKRAQRESAISLSPNTEVSVHILNPPNHLNAANTFNNSCLNRSIPVTNKDQNGMVPCVKDILHSGSASTGHKTLQDILNPAFKPIELPGGQVILNNNGNNFQNSVHSSLFQASSVNNSLHSGNVMACFAASSVNNLQHSGNVTCFPASSVNNSLHSGNMMACFPPCYVNNLQLLENMTACFPAVVKNILPQSNIGLSSNLVLNSLPVSALTALLPNGTFLPGCHATPAPVNNIQQAKVYVKNDAQQNNMTWYNLTGSCGNSMLTTDLEILQKIPTDVGNVGGSCIQNVNNLHPDS